MVVYICKYTEFHSICYNPDGWIIEWYLNCTLINLILFFFSSSSSFFLITKKASNWKMVGHLEPTMSTLQIRWPSWLMPIILATWDAEIRITRPHLKVTTANWTGGGAQMVDHLLCKGKALTEFKPHSHLKKKKN
jgi:hypothetical protein